MHDLISKSITCPYCWESFTIHIDPSIENGETYIEDCYVCCRPIEIHIIKMHEMTADVHITKIEGNEY